MLAINYNNNNTVIAAPIDAMPDITNHEQMEPDRAKVSLNQDLNLRVWDSLTRHILMSYCGAETRELIHVCEDYDCYLGDLYKIL